MTLAEDTMTPDDLREARRLLQYTQMALANALHVHVATVARWEDSTPIPGPAIVAIRYMLREKQAR